MRFNNLLFAVSILFAMAVASCSTPKDVAYFQEMAIQTPSQVDVKSVVIKPNDKLSIIVNSRDPMVANMFNLPYTNRLLGQTSALANNNTSQESVPTLSIRTETSTFRSLERFTSEGSPAWKWPESSRACL